MASLNRATLIGNLGKDPAVRYTAEGAAWPCPISPDTSDGMMMPGEKKDDTQQKNIH